MLAEHRDDVTEAGRRQEATEQQEVEAGGRAGGHADGETQRALRRQEGRGALSCRAADEGHWVGLRASLEGVARWCGSRRLYKAFAATPHSPRASQNPVSLMLLHSSHAAAPSIAPPVPPPPTTRLAPPPSPTLPAPAVSPSRQVGRRHSQLHSGEVAARGGGDTCLLQ